MIWKLHSDRHLKEEFGDITEIGVFGMYARRQKTTKKRRLTLVRRILSAANPTKVPLCATVGDAIAHATVRFEGQAEVHGCARNVSYYVQADLTDIRKVQIRREPEAILVRPLLMGRNSNHYVLVFSKAWIITFPKYSPSPRSLFRG